MKDLGKDTAIKIEKDVVHINGFDAKTQEEFYIKMRPFIQVVSKDRYEELLEERGFWANDYAAAHAIFHRVPDPVSSKTSSKLEKIFVIVNKDRYKGKERTLMQAHIRHELAELWIYGKQGFSLLDPMKKADVFETNKIADLAHNYARQEELRYAIAQGFGDEDMQFIREHDSPKGAARSELTYKKLKARIERGNKQGK